MAIGTLSGYALKMVSLPADHTYVESSAGHVWPCWGRSAGGHLVCQGPGNVDQADCLSQPSSQAGIVYAVTGVCHQTANRILFPATLFVSGAARYRMSVFTWGVYGRDRATGRLYSPSSNPWPELTTCSSSHSHP